ncbi:hypothetical protein HK102_002534 [Quaeritorhiza haematococci]|nr:hypothetical protein HK102_002534 [Quaeritorhiza haematococci]
MYETPTIKIAYFSFTEDDEQSQISNGGGVSPAKVFIGPFLDSLQVLSESVFEEYAPSKPYSLPPAPFVRGPDFLYPAPREPETFESISHKGCPLRMKCASMRVMGGAPMSPSAPVDTVTVVATVMNPGDKPVTIMEADMFWRMRDPPRKELFGSLAPEAWEEEIHKPSMEWAKTDSLSVFVGSKTNQAANQLAALSGTGADESSLPVLIPPQGFTHITFQASIPHPSWLPRSRPWDHRAARLPFFAPLLADVEIRDMYGAFTTLTCEYVVTTERLFIQRNEADADQAFFFCDEAMLPDRIYVRVLKSAGGVESPIVFKSMRDTVEVTLDDLRRAVWKAEQHDVDIVSLDEDNGSRSRSNETYSISFAAVVDRLCRRVCAIRVILESFVASGVDRGGRNMSSTGESDIVGATPATTVKSISYFAVPLYGDTSRQRDSSPSLISTMQPPSPEYRLQGSYKPQYLEQKKSPFELRIKPSEDQANNTTTVGGSDTIGVTGRDRLGGEKTTSDSPVPSIPSSPFLLPNTQDSIQVAIQAALKAQFQTADLKESLKPVLRETLSEVLLESNSFRTFVTGVIEGAVSSAMAGMEKRIADGVAMRLMEGYGQRTRELGQVVEALESRVQRRGSVSSRSSWNGSVAGSERSSYLGPRSPVSGGFGIAGSGHLN